MCSAAGGSVHNNRALLPPCATRDVCHQGVSYCLNSLKHKTRTAGTLAHSGQRVSKVPVPHKGLALLFTSAQPKVLSWLQSLPVPGAQPEQEAQGSRDPQKLLQAQHPQGQGSPVSTAQNCCKHSIHTVRSPQFPQPM